MKKVFGIAGVVLSLTVFAFSDDSGLLDKNAETVTNRALHNSSISENGNSEMEEKDHFYLYDEYAFSAAEDGGILQALTYVVPGKEVGEKGLEGVVFEITFIVIDRYKSLDKTRRVNEYMIAVIVYPGPDSPGGLIQYELDMKELDEIIFGKRTGA